MIATNIYRTVLAATAYDINALLIKHDEGEDMKVTNDKVIEISRRMLELALQFKGQEEA